MDPNNKISITVCGDGGCGKSSITLRLVRSQWTSEYDPTIEDSYSVTRTIDGQTYLLVLTDTAGQEEYRGLWTASNLKSDAFLLVYDITNAASLDALDHFHSLIEMEEEERLDADAVGPVKIVAGNKCDLQGQRVVRSQQGLEWARQRRCGFMETSARERVNIEETFALIVRRVVEARKLHAAGEMGGGDGGVGGGGGGGGGHAPPRTMPLTPVSEKPITTTIDPAALQRRDRLRGGFWRRLKCW